MPILILAVPRRRIIPLFLTLLAWFTPLSAQYLRPDPEVLLIERAGTPLRNPASGGLASPVSQLIDIDDDGDDDLFVLDRDGTLQFFEHAVSSTPGRWIFRTASYQGVAIHAWFRFSDIDGDGDVDLFTGGQGSTVHWYRNVGTSAVAVLDRTSRPLLTETGDPVLSELISVPSFEDVDGDGDLDFFSGNSIGSIWYYQNTGTAANARFRFITDQYQGIVIIGGAGAASQSRAADDAGIKHGAMSLAFADIDGDADLDMFWGDFFNRALYFLRNDGSATSPQFVLVDSTFAGEASLSTPGFNMPLFSDIDRDGDLDLFVSVASGLLSVGNFLAFENTGTAFSPIFSPVITDPLSQFDAGSASSPSVGDWTGDGLPDLLIGTEDGRIVLLERTSSDSLVFLWTTDSLLTLAGSFNLAPAVGDIESDGVADLIVGSFAGQLQLFRRVALAAVEDTTFSLRGVVFGLNASPALGDLDGDGDEDLLVGTGNGRMTFVENQGTPGAPVWVVQNAFFASIDVGEDAKPVIADINGDGLQDILVGSREQGVRTFLQDGQGYLEHPLIADAARQIVRSAPAVLFSGERFIMLSGNVKGGLYTFSSSRPYRLTSTPVTLLPPYPNPSRTTLTILAEVHRDGPYRLSLSDILGRTVSTVHDGTLTRGIHVFQADVRSLSAGAYVVRVRHDGGSSASSIVVLR